MYQIKKLLASLFENDKENQEHVFSELPEDYKPVLEDFLSKNEIVSEYIDNGGIPFKSDDHSFYEALDTTHPGYEIFIEILENY